MNTRPRGAAPNYTNAFLVSAGALCVMGLWVIWAIWGFLAAIATSYATDRAITFGARRASRG